MARSKENKKRVNDQKKRERHERLAAKRAAKEPPVITEADLLAFQLAHFGDNAGPETWFVDAQTAITYEPAWDVWEEEDDGLGYYEDGVKRTLTDEQIEMFRHSEMEQLARAERLQREEEEWQGGGDAGNEVEQVVGSPLSDDSSMDEDLVGLATATTTKRTNAPILSSATRQPTISSLPPPAFSSTKRSNSASTPGAGSSASSNSAARPKKKQRKEEVPYEERNKRKWEEHIATVDPIKGTWMYDSKTENRLRREMDDVKAESVELDY